MPDRSPTGLAAGVQVHPTRLCNLACAHCYTESGPGVRGELRPELLAACLREASRLGYRDLAVSGGEPLVYEPLPELLAAARAHGMRTALTTNGLLATPRRWSRVAPLLDLAAISIDGRSHEHDAIRGRRGAFARTVANLSVIRDSGVPFAFIFTLTQHNADSIEFVVQLAAEHGASAVQVHPLTLHGRAVTGMGGERPDDIELLVALHEARRVGRELGVAVHVDAVTREQLLAYRNRLVPRTRVTALTEVAPVLVVEADGGVMPMTHELHPGLRLGSLHDGPLSELAREWLAAGHGGVLARACARTWHELVEGEVAAAYWYDEVAARTRLASAASGCSRTTAVAA